MTQPQRQIVEPQERVEAPVPQVSDSNDQPEEIKMDGEEDTVVDPGMDVDVINAERSSRVNADVARWRRRRQAQRRVRRGSCTEVAPALEDDSQRELYQEAASRQLANSKPAVDTSLLGIEVK